MGEIVKTPENDRVDNVGEAEAKSLDISGDNMGSGSG